jgi:excisionase family DNA binding protein
MNAFSAASPGHDIAAPTTDCLALSPRQAAALLGLSERFVAKLIASGDLPSARIGARRLIRRADLETWLSDRVRQTQEGPRHEQ